MYYIKTGKQSKAFWKCLLKAALRGKIPKKHIVRYFKIRTKSILQAVKVAACAVLYEIRTISVKTAICVSAGVIVTSLTLNLCVLDVRMDKLQAERLRLSETKTELEKDIQILESSLESKEQAVESKDEIIQRQQAALSDSENQKEEIVKNFTEKIDGIEFTGSASASRSSADLDGAQSNILETEMLIRDALGYTDAANALVDKLRAKADEIQDVKDRYPDYFPTVGNFDSPFGYRQDPLTGETRYHAGMDIDASMGEAVWAAGKGTVIFTGVDSGYGNHICVDHGGGLVTKYAHLSEILVSVGDAVGKGDLIGRVGATGRVTGPHLHFEVIKDGQTVSPVDYIGQH